MGAAKKFCGSPNKVKYHRLVNSKCALRKSAKSRDYSDIVFSVVLMTSCKIFDGPRIASEITFVKWDLNRGQPSIRFDGYQRGFFVPSGAVAISWQYISVASFNFLVRVSLLSQRLRHHVKVPHTFIQRIYFVLFGARGRSFSSNFIDIPQVAWCRWARCVLWNTKKMKKL